METEKTLIPVYKSTRDKLKQVKITKLETYDEILLRLLENKKFGKIKE